MHIPELYGVFPGHMMMLILQQPQERSRNRSKYGKESQVENKLENSTAIYLKKTQVQQLSDSYLTFLTKVIL